MRLSDYIIDNDRYLANQALDESERMLDNSLQKVIEIYCNPHLNINHVILWQK